MRNVLLPGRETPHRNRAMSELLLELFSEEIPARMQKRAAADLEKAFNDKLMAEGFMPDGIKSFATPRRLSLVATGIPEVQPDRREEKKGPRVGAPEKAVAGFLKSVGFSSLYECEQREDKKGAYYVALIEEKGRPTADVIAETVPEIVRQFSWQKSMRWGAASGQEGSLKWVRPLHSILCTFNGEVVPFEISGISSDDKTYGHRFLSPNEIQARSFEDYEAALRRAKVLLNADERAELIAGEAKTLCEAQGLEIVDDAALLEEVAGLTEWPVVMIGSYDEKFLSLPDEVLIASMRGHQKYFSVYDPKKKCLANKFIFVANIEAPDGGDAMRTGYERVLTARLSDGWYLYHQDLKKPLDARVSDLDRITFFEGLGSVGDKVARVAALAKEFATTLGSDPSNAEKAAILAKSDLVTGMVGEFPELQGVMGRYYALEQGEDGAIADAIRDHYKPQGQADETPSEPVSVAVALADRMDTLAAFWSIDEKPTGSKDPFALRRAALGVIDLILSNDLRLDLKSIKGAQYPNGANVAAVIKDTDLLDFFYDRLKVFLRDKTNKFGGYRHDQIDSVLKNIHSDTQVDFMTILARVKAVKSFLDSDDGKNLAAGYKRAANILKAESKKGELPKASALDPTKFVESKEKVLFGSLEDAEVIVETALEQEDFEGAMTALSSLRGPIDQFFEDVTVNADDSDLRQNRLSLLARFQASTARVADFSKLEG